MNWHHKASKILITGKSGSGKTTEWMSRMVEIKPGFLWVFDPDLEFCAKAGVVPVQRTGDVLKSARAGVVAFDPSLEFPGDTGAGLEWFCDCVYSVSRRLPGVKLVAIDEIQKHTRLRDGGIPHSMQVLLDVGRREEVDMLLVSQTPNRVNDAIRCQLTEITTLCHTDRLPLEWLEREGFDPDAVKTLTMPGGKIVKKYS